MFVKQIIIVIIFNIPITAQKMLNKTQPNWPQLVLISRPFLTNVPNQSLVLLQQPKKKKQPLIHPPNTTNLSTHTLLAPMIGCSCCPPSTHQCLIPFSFSYVYIENWLPSDFLLLLLVTVSLFPCRILVILLLNKIDFQYIAWSSASKSLKSIFMKHFRYHLKANLIQNNSLVHKMSYFECFQKF